MTDDSLFTKLVSLREEDFLTVTFGYLLQQDQKLKSDYLQLLGIPNADRCAVTMQRRYGENFEDRPDMEIRGPGIIVFQENKVQSVESHNQLRRYARRLRDREEKRKLLVYMSKRYAEARVRQANYHVPSVFLRWEQVAPLIKDMNQAQRKHTWLREELYRFLEEKEMVPPPALDADKLNRYWPVFEPQRETLTKLLEASVQAIENTWGAKGYRCALDSSSTSTGLDLYICPTKGKLVKYFSGYNGYLWMGSGVYFDTYDREAYAYSGIGWTRDHSDRVSKAATNLLNSKGFRQDDEKYDGWYRYVPLRKIVGRPKNFEHQKEALSKWISTNTRIVLRSFAIIMNGW